ncbi:endo alpha-1,4 polygalactosaminidase [Microbacteriaceae bacterium VKM Ac-2854]|nr:endo alpha-1,4 polygalactosaminidase [Microbacteriaceae bacterium VKM Ac-2854]
MRRLALILFCALGLTACSAAPTAFPADGVADYQLGGAYDPPAGVTIVERDSDAEPAEGRYSICYVNGFQSQPGQGEEWLDAGLVLLADGEAVIDENWPDEMLLDTSTPQARAAIAERIGAVIDSCAEKGFDAVEIDNLDSDTRSNGALTDEDNRALATLYVQRAHAAGLAIGQKNTADRAEEYADDPGFDFAVSEECFTFDECAAYTDAYGADVIDIEYTDDLRGDFADVCADPATPPISLLRDRELVPAEHPGYVYEHC